MASLRDAERSIVILAFDVKSSRFTEKKGQLFDGMPLVKLVK
jgi:hypothetical protein